MAGKIKTWLVISKLPENPLEGKRRGEPEQPRHLLPCPDPCQQVCFHEISSKNQKKISKRQRKRGNSVSEDHFIVYLNGCTNNLMNRIFFLNSTLHIFRTQFRDAGGGGAGGARAPPKFGILVNPIRTKGGRLCPPYYYWPPHLFGRCGASVIYVIFFNS